MRDDNPRSSEGRLPWAGQQEELRFSLLCEGHIIRLNPGTFTLGRSSECEIVVDDMLASREHARLHVTETSIVLEDLDSTNGLYLNGNRVRDRVNLKAGDMIIIGTQELQVGALPVNPDATQPSFVTSARGLMDLDDPMPTSETIKAPPPKLSTDEHAGTERANTFQTLQPIVRRLLAEGRTDAVDRLLRQLVTSLRDGAVNGEHIPSETLEIAASLMANVAENTLDPFWIDSIIEIHTLARQPLPGPVIVQLAPLVTAISGSDRSIQLEYARVLKKLGPTLPLTEKILVERTLTILPNEER